jgi:hypothetical protein
LNYPYNQGSIIDLSGSSPVKSDFTTPFASLSGFTAASPTKWFVSNNHGLVIDGSSVGVTRTLDLGQAWSIAGGTAKAAIATANGTITYLNPAQPTTSGTITFSSSKVLLSLDDTLLGAFANTTDSPYLPDRTLNFYSLPSGNLISNLPSQIGSAPVRADFSFSGSGTVVGQTYESSNTATVGPIDGTVSFSPTPSDYTNAPRLSPDGTLAAVGTGSATPSINFYKNGVLVGAVSGLPIAWIDNNRLLVYNTTGLSSTSPSYKNPTIVDSTGATLSTTALSTTLSQFQPVGTDRAYSPDKNTIYLMSTGQAVWTATAPSTNGAIAGPYVVFASGNSVLIDAY